MAHTPGPWTVEDPLGNEQLCIVEAGKPTYEWRFIAVVGHDDPKEGEPWISIEQRDANARLIAAAPELLEALKDLVRLTQHICQTTGYSAKLDMHRAAIAKATETPASEAASGEKQG